MDIARAAKAARQSHNRFCLAVDDALLGVYALSLYYAEERIIVFVGKSRSDLASLVTSLRAVGVRCASIHAGSKKRRGREDDAPTVLLVCDDALKGTNATAVCNNMGGSNIVAHVDGAQRAKREALITPTAIRVDLFKSNEPPHPVLRDSRWGIAAYRCRLATAPANSPEERRSARLRLAVALRAPSTTAIKTTRRKMVLLGMLSFDVPPGFEFGVHAKISQGDYRELARTRYLDRRLPDPRLVTDAWLGDQRTGATADVVSKRVARAVREFGVADGWQPNPDDAEDWGGRYGKACAHNEVCMHCARPFVPLEVLNTRACSRDHPAPGNDGYDGCLDFLAVQCKRKREAATVWDTDNFIWISPKGQRDVVPKAPLLDWALPRLELVLPALRDLTLGSRGRASPRAWFAFIDDLLRLGLRAAAKRHTVLGPPRPTVTIVAFILGGDPAAWRKAYPRTSGRREAPPHTMRESR